MYFFSPPGLSNTLLVPNKKKKSWQYVLETNEIWIVSSLYFIVWMFTICGLSTTPTAGEIKGLRERVLVPQHNDGLDKEIEFRNAARNLWVKTFTSWRILGVKKKWLYSSFFEGWVGETLINCWRIAFSWYKFSLQLTLNVIWTNFHSIPKTLAFCGSWTLCQKMLSSCYCYQKWNQRSSVV